MWNCTASHLLIWKCITWLIFTKLCLKSQPTATWDDSEVHICPVGYGLSMYDTNHYFSHGSHNNIFFSWSSCPHQKARHFFYLLNWVQNDNNDSRSPDPWTRMSFLQGTLARVGPSDMFWGPILGSNDLHINELILENYTRFRHVGFLWTRNSLGHAGMDPCGKVISWFDGKFS